MGRTIYDVALGLAREIGWRNVSRGPLLDACIAAGLVGECSPTSWARNYLRGANSISALRAKLSELPDLPEGSPLGSTSGAWRNQNQRAILDAAWRLALAERRLLVPRREVAKAAGVSDGLVSLSWGGMAALRRAVIDRARTSDDPGAQQLVLQAQAMGLTA